MFSKYHSFPQSESCLSFRQWFSLILLTKLISLTTTIRMIETWQYLQIVTCVLSHICGLQTNWRYSLAPSLHSQGQYQKKNIELLILIKWGFAQINAHEQKFNFLFYLMIDYYTPSCTLPCALFMCKLHQSLLTLLWNVHPHSHQFLYSWFRLDYIRTIIQWQC